MYRVSVRNRFFDTVFPKAAKYFVVGGMSAVTDWVLFSAFLYGLDLHYAIAAILSFVLATAVNYYLSIRFVFVSGRHARHREIMLVYLVSTFGMLIHLAILSALIELLYLHPLIAKVIATGGAFVWNFSARYLWIFTR